MKLIYISTGYNTGIALPIADIGIIERIQFIKHKGYNNLDSPEIDTEQRAMSQIIYSSEIGKQAKLDKQIKEAQEDLLANQKHIEYLESQK